MRFSTYATQVLLTLVAGALCVSSVGAQAAVAATSSDSSTVVTIPRPDSAVVEMELDLSQDNLLPQISTMLEKVLVSVGGEAGKVFSSQLEKADSLKSFFKDVRQLTLVQQKLTAPDNLESRTYSFQMDTMNYYVDKVFVPAAAKAGLKKVFSYNKEERQVHFWCGSGGYNPYLVWVTPDESSPDIRVTAISIDGGVDISVMLPLLTARLTNESFEIGLGMTIPGDSVEGTSAQNTE